MKSGIAFHCHHDMLYEYVYDYDERVTYIKENKPKCEQELRLRLFKLIPDDKLPGGESPEYIAWKKARETCAKAWAARAKAGKVLGEAWGETYTKAWVAYCKSWDACAKAQKVNDEAWRDYAKVYGKEIERLHIELCPNCSWNGNTIFKKPVKK